jgi:hypothetical protein
MAFVIKNPQVLLIKVFSSFGLELALCIANPDLLVRTHEFCTRLCRSPEVPRIIFVASRVGKHDNL